MNSSAGVAQNQFILFRFLIPLLFEFQNYQYLDHKCKAGKPKRNFSGPVTTGGFEKESPDPHPIHHFVIEKITLRSTIHRKCQPLHITTKDTPHPLSITLE